MKTVQIFCGALFWGQIFGQNIGRLKKEARRNVFANQLKIEIILITSVSKAERTEIPTSNTRVLEKK